jgi:hypothetical protein
MTEAETPIYPVAMIYGMLIIQEMQNFESGKLPNYVIKRAIRHHGYTYEVLQTHEGGWKVLQKQGEVGLPILEMLGEFLSFSWFSTRKLTRVSTCNLK